MGTGRVDEDVISNAPISNLTPYYFTVSSLLCTFKSRTDLTLTFVTEQVNIWRYI